jgi:methionyl-tRNA formyltransferase
VQRCLENGDPVTGVSILGTVKEMDAGPVYAKQEMKLNGNEIAPDLLNQLFIQGKTWLVPPVS